MKPQTFTTEDAEKKISDFVKALCPQHLFLLKKNVLGQKINTPRAQRGERSHFPETFICLNFLSVSSLVNFENAGRKEGKG